jgi:uncharacterized membrane protein
VINTQGSQLAVNVPGKLVGKVRFDPPANARKMQLCTIGITQSHKIRGDNAFAAPKILAALGMSASTDKYGCVQATIIDHADPQLVLEVSQATLRGWRRHTTLIPLVTKATTCLGILALIACLAALQRRYGGAWSPARLTVWVENRLAIVFVVITLPFGIAMALIGPPTSVPDEQAHLAKIAAVADGRAFGTLDDHKIEDINSGYGGLSNGALPHANGLSLKSLRSIVAQDLVCNRRTSNFPSNALGYAPLPYVLAAIDYRISCAAGSSFGTFFYSSRIINLLVAVLLTALGIAAAGTGRWVIFVFGSLPMSVYLMGSLSADSLAIGSSLWLLGLVSGLLSGRLKSGTGTTSFLTIAGLMVALSKPGYVWLVVAVALCYRPFPSFRHYAINVLIAVSLPLVAHTYYLYHMAGFTVPFPGVDQHANASSLIENPLHFLQLVSATLLSDNLQVLYETMVGRLGWLDVSIGTVGITCTAIAITLSLLCNSSTFTGGHIARAGLIALALVASVALCVPLYIAWTLPGSSVISGLQGRYFIPAIATLCLGLSICIPASFRRWLIPAMLSCIFIPLFAATMALWLHYYSH